MASLHVATFPVGLNEEIKEFQNLVEPRSQCAESKQKVKIVGIVGPGGCGKTTFVKMYFNQKMSSYKASSFLFDVRDAAANNRLPDLQKNLLKDLAHIKEANFFDILEGKRTLERHLQSVKALIVLDDVDHINQIEAMLPLNGNLQPDSLIIVTTRDSSVIISSASISPSVSVSVYKKQALDLVHAYQLFCWHAFLRDSPAKGFEDLVARFVTAAEGLPLILKVLGSHLYGNTGRDYWKFLLAKVSRILPGDVKQILKVSYDALDEEQQQMFLDVACFFIGERKDMTISIWDGSSSDSVLWDGRHGFQILENKCLVEVDHNNCIRMHNHLRDLGREIAIKSTPSRFWSHSQFVNDQRPLEERLPIRGIMAATGSIGIWGDAICNLHYEPPFEECMQLLTGHSTSRSMRLRPSALGLQLLVVRGSYFKEQFAKLSEELVWLRWYDFPHGKLPSWLSTGKLKILELYQAKRLTELWGPDDSPPLQLRELIIEFSNNGLRELPADIDRQVNLELLEIGDPCLTSLSTSLGNVSSLIRLSIKGCPKLPSLQNLSSLIKLRIEGCTELRHLPAVGRLTRLECLELESSGVECLPEGFGQLVNLRKLCLLHTGLRELPADIERLAKLEVLEIESNCLTSLPIALGNLSSLIKLRIRSRKLKYLPSLGNLSSLIELKIDYCRELTHLPAVGCLTCLEKLELQFLGVEYLPQGFGQLFNLQNLRILRCPIRKLHLDSSMPKFPRLYSINLIGTKVTTISISENCCPSLKYLSLCGSHDLMEIETLPTTLKHVEIRNCCKLKNIRCVAGLGKIPYFEISNCPGLAELPGFAGRAELQD